MSSRKRSRSPSSHSSKERSGKHRKSSKRRRSHDGQCGTDTTSTSGNPVAFTELLKQMSGISQAVKNLGERLTNLETAAASNGPGRSNNNVNVQAMAASECPVVTQAGEASFSNEINSMDQLSVVVTQDPDLIDPIAPETLETDLGHGDGPQTSESLNNDSTLSTKVKQSGQSLEEKLGHDESALKGQLFDPVDHDPSWATSDSFKSFLETNFRRSLSSSQIFSILEQTSLPDLDVFTTPKLDKTIIDQVPSQFKKSVEIRDKELLNSFASAHGRDNLIGAPRESRLKGASRDSKARVATQRRESRLKGASRDSKARVATQRRDSRQKGASRDSKARVATQRRDSRQKGATQQKSATQQKGATQQKKRDSTKRRDSTKKARLNKKTICS